MVLGWAVEAANAAGWRIACHGMLSMVLKTTCTSDWTGRVLVSCRRGVVTVEGHISRNTKVHKVFSSSHLHDCHCGPWLYKLLVRHFSSMIAVQAPPTPAVGKPVLQALLLRTAKMAVYGYDVECEVKKLLIGFYQVRIGSKQVFIKFKGSNVTLNYPTHITIPVNGTFEPLFHPPWKNPVEYGLLAHKLFIIFTCIVKISR